MYSGVLKIASTSDNIDISTQEVGKLSVISRIGTIIFNTDTEPPKLREHFTNIALIGIYFGGFDYIYTNK